MNILLLLLIFPVAILAETEFYLSTSRAPYFNNCTVRKDSLPVLCEIASKITIYGIVWNPDSLVWCTREGYYRSNVDENEIEWKIDNGPTMMGGLNYGIPVLDTLEHIIVATYLEFPSVSFRYKARNKLPFLICSRNEEIFLSDSIHMIIESTLPATLNDLSPIPEIQHATTVNDSIYRYTSIIENLAIITFNSPTDTSIKLISFNSYELHNRGVDFKMTYSPVLNSYSFLFPLAQTGVLAKKQTITHTDTINDTIVAVFKRQSDFDTLLLRYSIFYYTSCPTCPQVKIRGLRSFQKTGVASFKKAVRIYDLKGRMVNKFQAGATNSCYHALSKGIYLLQKNKSGPIAVHQNIFTK